MSKSIIQEVRDYLATQRGKWPQICSETGLDYSWLSKVASGKIKNPGARQIELLAARIQKKK